MRLLSHPTPDIEHWRRIESVLDQALELEPRDVPALLARECAGHPALRREIEALLDADRRATGLMSVAAAQMLDPFEDDAPPAPATIGRYRVTATLGRGGMGVVYEGRDDVLGHRVALKSLPAEYARDPARLERFLCEARLLGALQSPHVAAFHGIAREGGQRYLVLERIDGVTLAERLRTGPLPVGEALEIAGQVAEALVAVHAVGIVHRDLKPANVMITPGGLVKVLDLGLAQVATATGEDSAWARAGTPGYMSPEQIQGSGQDKRSDLFAWGVLTWECLTGRAPFAGATVEERLTATFERTLDPDELPAAAPEAVRRQVLSALARDPAQRVSNAETILFAFVRPVTPREQPESPQSRRRRRMGAPLAPFIGRERERDVVGALIERTSLVTLTGPGGCGKSRLARALADDWRTRVFYAELGAARDATGFGEAVAEAAGARYTDDKALSSWLAALSDQHGGGLLVLDHCEHVAALCAGFLAALRERAPRLRVLATSREPLGVAGEQVVRVPPLSLPAADLAGAALTAAIDASEAVRLFIARARMLGPEFVPAPVDLPLVAGICRHVDGVPLAVELAAARLREQPLAAIAAALAPDTGGRSGAGALDDVIRASYERLAERERRFLRAFSVFRGGGDFECAAAVACPEDDRFEALDTLATLLDRSLVTIERADRAEPRYRLLEPIRQFAGARRDEEGEAATLRARHRDVFLAAAERLAPSVVQGAAQARALAWLEGEHANVIAAIELEEPRAEPGGRPDASPAQKALRLASAVWWFWYVRGHFTRGRAALALALARPGANAPTPARALALFAAGALAVFQGDYPEGRRLSHDAVAAFTALEDDLGVARATCHLALCDGGEGRFAEAAQAYALAIDIFRRLGDVRRLSATLNNRGVLDRQRDDFAAAHVHHSEALEWFRRAGDQDGTVVTLVNLALASSRLGRAPEAARHLSEALALVRDLRARRAGAAALEVAAELLAAHHEPIAATQRLGAAAALRSTIHLPADDWWRRSREALEARLRAELGDEAFVQHLAAGGERTFEQALDDALAPPSSDVAGAAT